ncbi:MAG: dystroglycan-type cadherin-like protein [Deltaproteobacteria bacterium]|nr:dystroglycan-type cadherin-like protein [Deltaproteobacteria bacterium]
MGSRTIVIIVVVVLAGIVGVMGYYFFKGPSAPSGGPSAAPSPNAVEGPGMNVAAGSVQMAVAKAKLQLETAEDKSMIKVVIDKVTGTDGREVTYKFNWTLNGQPAGDDSDRLSGFKRGDRVAVKVTPIEGDKPGQARFLDFLVNNTPPRVAESKQVGFDGKTFTYQVRGADQDGDTLSYALEDAPQGMTINSHTGLATWPIKENDYGERTFKVKIDDGKSGVAIHTVKVDISKSSQEVKAPDDQK